VVLHDGVSTQHVVGWLVLVEMDVVSSSDRMLKNAKCQLTLDT
jgi:hypothetical protein